MRLEGKVAIITGGAHGMGAEEAKLFAREGAKVVIADIREEDARKVAAEIAEAGGESMVVMLDVSNEDQWETSVAAVVTKFGKLDILVNNAGINRDRLLLRMKSEDWDEVIQVDLRGAFLCTRFVMPHLIKQRSGRIINISSVVGISGNPGQANYAAAKAGLIGFTKSVAREVASRNVTVNALAPGYITTGMVEHLPEETKSQILSRIPMGRFGAAEDVSEAVVFLCSNGASYITGEVLTIDGGLIA